MNKIEISPVCLLRFEHFISSSEILGCQSESEFEFESEG